jgi:hypothetical protein
MRRLVLILASIMLTGSIAMGARAELSVPANIHDAGWIAGVWSSESPAETGGASTSVEVWSPPAAGAMLGHGGVLGPDGNLVFWEGLNIYESDGTLVYVPFPGGKPATVVFPLVQHSADRLEFRNLEHDFPQRIIYSRLDSERMLIEAHGSGRSLRWTMQRQCHFVDTGDGAVCVNPEQRP